VPRCKGIQDSSDHVKIAGQHGKSNLGDTLKDLEKSAEIIVHLVQCTRL